MNNIRAYIISELSKIVAHNAVIIDWGSGDDSTKAQRFMQHKDCEIISVDINPARKPSLIADMCKPLTIKEADIAFCLETLEHCYNPDEVLNNIYNNLKIGGKLYISVPFITSVHGRRDYWRFTRLGISTLLKRHKFKILSAVQKRHDARIGYFIEAIK